MTWNILSCLEEEKEIGFDARMRAVCAEIERLDPHIACLQEVTAQAAELLAEHLLPRFSTIWKAEPVSFAPGVRLGQAVLHRLAEPLDVWREVFQDDEGLLVCRWHGLLLVNVHATSGSAWSGLPGAELRRRAEARRRDYTRVLELARGAPAGAICAAAGDFNADLGCDAPPRPELAELLQHFRDPWRELCAPGGATETHENTLRRRLKPAQRKHDRYDAVLYCGPASAEQVLIAGAAPAVEVPGVGRFCCSDHYAAVAQLRLLGDGPGPPQPGGRGDGAHLPP